MGHYSGCARQNGGMDLAALALFGVVLGILFWRAITRERRDYQRFKQMRSTVARQKVFRRWATEAAIVLGGLSVATIVGAWSAIPEALAAAQQWPPVAALRDIWLGPWGWPLAIAGTLLVLALLIVPVLSIRNSLDEAPTIGDIRALLPRTRGELPYGAALSINAGIFEELLFRLGMPALVFVITGDAVIAFAAATIVFGLLHVYQGPLGVVFSTVLGVVFLLLYLVTGWIVVPIVLHALIDLRSMILIPVVLGKISLRPAAQIGSTP
jgi:membrane protease YdiL (CAAX protease family)